MTRIARALAAGTASAALLMTLAGCVPAQAPPPSPAASASVAAASPTPTPAEPTVPVSRVPFACGDLLDQDAVDSVLQAATPLVRLPGHETLSTYGLEQMGAVNCTWEDPVYSARLELTIVPDAPLAAWDESVKLIESDADSSRFGEESYLHCDGHRCDLNLLFDGYWVDMVAHSPGGTAIDQQAVIDVLFAPVVDRVRATPAPPALWLPAGLSTYPPQATCDDLIDPAVVSTLSGVAVQGPDFAGPLSQMGARSAPGAAVGQRDCVWQGARASLLPGGAWAFGRAVADFGGAPASDSGDIRFSRFTTEFEVPVLLATDGQDLVLVDTAATGNPGDFLLEFARDLLD